MMNSRQMVIAVVDDDIRILESIDDLLEAAGYSVLMYSSAEAIIEEGILGRVDCLITDIGLPVIDGFELRRAVRATYPCLPVIFITGRQEAGDQRRASEGAHHGFFRKPFEPAALLDAVSRAVSTRTGDEGT